MNTRKIASTRRNFIKSAALLSAVGATEVATGMAEVTANAPAPKPNILMICADQFRADFIGAARQNPSTQTKNLDAMAQVGTLCKQVVCNQPLCSPSRASFLTSRYATETGVWKLGLELDHTLPTLADLFAQNGFSTHFIGKWHLSSTGRESEAMTGPNTLGWIPPGPSRAGFQTWEGANVLEITSHAYEGSYWDNEGIDLKFHDRYRADFVVDRAIRFIEQPHDKPWFLFLSQLEPHQQNDIDQFVAPKGYDERYKNAFVPPDIRSLPGNWQDHLPGYYGCVQAIDESVGRIISALDKKGDLDNTIILFFSDHGCHFRTRVGEYKRSPHDASLRVPFILQGPGFNNSIELSQQITLLDLMPTLLDAAGIKQPPSLRGRSIIPLLHDAGVRARWDEEPAYIQISDSMCARAIRTPEWCYCVCDLSIPGDTQSNSTDYLEWALYSLTGDPAQQHNLIGRPEFKRITAHLRGLMEQQIVRTGEPAATITPARVFNS